METLIGAQWGIILKYRLHVLKKDRFCKYTKDPVSNGIILGCNMGHVDPNTIINQESVLMRPRALPSREDNPFLGRCVVSKETNDGMQVSGKRVDEGLECCYIVDY